MKYILMMHCPRNAYDAFGAWAPQDIQAHLNFMKSLNKELAAAGELVSAEGLADPKQATIVRAGDDGAPVTDGVFPESKEFLAGYWIVDVENLILVLHADDDRAGDVDRLDLRFGLRLGFFHMLRSPASNSCYGEAP